MKLLVHGCNSSLSLGGAMPRWKARDGRLYCVCQLAKCYVKNGGWDKNLRVNQGTRAAENFVRDLTLSTAFI